MTLAIILLLAFLIVTGILVRRTLVAQAIRDRIDMMRTQYIMTDDDDWLI